MLLYHGTDNLSAESIITRGINLKIGDESVDNGLGFYMTPSFDFASRRALSTVIKREKFSDKEIYPAVIRVEFEISDSKQLSIKEFKTSDYAWKEFVLYNRLGVRFLEKWNIKSENHNLDCKYDVVFDPTADAGLTAIVTQARYCNRRENLEEFINSIDIKDDPNWDKQVSIHTDKAVVSCIKSMNIQCI